MGEEGVRFMRFLSIKLSERGSACITFKYGVPTRARTKSSIDKSCVILPVKP